MTARATTRRAWTGGRKRIPDVPAEPKRSARKNTKRWCRGKAGVEHAYAWADNKRFDYDGKRQGLPRVLACVACGRQKDMCWGTTACHCGGHMPLKTDDGAERQIWLRDQIAWRAERILWLFDPKVGAVVTVIVRTANFPPGKGDVLVTAEQEIAPALACAERLFYETEPLGDAPRAKRRT